MIKPSEGDLPEAAPAMVFSLRISLPDLPGTLGRVARAFGKGDVNILTLDVVDREDGMAIDDVRVEAPRGMQEALRRAAADVPGFAVEYVRPLEAFRHVLETLELAALLEDSGTAALARLVEHLPDTFGGTWALVVDVSAGAGGPPEVLAASLGAPSAARLPASWLDLSRLDPAQGGSEVASQPVPHHSGSGLEVAAALLGRPSAAVFLGRERGPRFRASELRHLGLLARIAAAVAARSDSLIQAV
jgi:ACT domain